VLKKLSRSPGLHERVLLAPRAFAVNDRVGQEKSFLKNFFLAMKSEKDY
jgi:hypothetical protein